jgi:LCP family protein required for cell wall assembly
VKKSTLLKGLLIVIFIVLAVIAAFFSFRTGKNFALTSPFEGLGDFSPTSSSSGQTGPDEAPDQPSTGTDPENPENPEDLPAAAQGWEGAERVTILVMGLDYRDWEVGEGAPRTDTMILLTIDPLSKTAGMLSIPRDLYVSIPGFNYDRINTAYRQGEVFELPGGGPALATATVEQLLGVPIDYYAQIDFFAFVRMIDEIGGLKIDVQEPIEVDPIGPGNHKFLEPGVQTLPGDVALAYARARNSEGGDFDRAQRQQQVILAIRDRILDFDLIPLLITRAGSLYNELAGGIRTNLSLEQAIQLGLLGLDIPVESINRGVIGSEHILFYTTPTGDQVLKPIPDKIRQIRNQVFGSENMNSPLFDLPANERIQAESANILLLNASSTNGLARDTMTYLNTFETVNIREENVTSAETTFTFTRIIDNTGNPNTVQWLVETLEIQPHLIFMEYDPSSPVDITVFLGDDWSGRLPRP